MADPVPGRRGVRPTGATAWHLTSAAALGIAVGVADARLAVAALGGALVAAAVVAVRRPLVGLTLLLAGYLTGGLQEHLVAVPGLLVWRDVLLAALLLRTAVAGRLSRVPRLPLAVVLMWAAHVLALAVVRDVPAAATLQGARLLFTGPAVLLVAAAWMTVDDLLRMLTWSAPVVAAATGLAVWQAQTDVSTLLAAGYEYGTTVRHAGGFVRAFGPLDHGLMFGHAMAVLVVVYVAAAWSSRGWPDVTRGHRMVLATTAGLAATGLALSLTRTAVIGAVVATLAVALVGAGRATGRRALMVGAVVLLGCAALVSVRGGAMFTRVLDGEDPSLTARLDTWASLRTHPDADLVTGSGPGTAGAVAQIVDTGADLPTVTDSWYAAVLVQYGVLGLVVLIVFMALLLAGLPPTRIRTSPAAAAAWGVVVHLGVTMATYNVWEELAAAVPAFLVLGAGLAAPVTADRRDRAAASNATTGSAA